MMRSAAVVFIASLAPASAYQAVHVARQTRATTIVATATVEPPSASAAPAIIPPQNRPEMLAQAKVQQRGSNSRSHKGSRVRLSPA